MVEFPLRKPWALVLTSEDFTKLHRHLFPGDQDEHGAVVKAGLATTDAGVRLLVREVHLARDGIDYVPGERGYRKLRAEFVLDRISECAEQRLVYLAVHNHGGRDEVEFSPTDFASHRRGYPALLDIVDGLPVGALVLAENAVAGEIWLPGRETVRIRETVVIGPSRKVFYPKRPRARGASATIYDRQSRLFGDRGQTILRDAKVAIIGLGGVGSILAEYLGRLGVGNVVLIDPDRIEVTNLPRVVGSSRWDALTWRDVKAPKWLARLLRTLRRKKVSIAARAIRRASRNAKSKKLFADIADDHVARQLRDCDYLFLAADTQRARLVFNTLVHQYLIPGVQLGAKVPVDRAGTVTDVFTVVRPVFPSKGCLLCNQLINPSRLQEESQTENERRVQRYIEDPGVVAPSVITLNATVASYAVNDFLFFVTGLASEDAETGYMRLYARERDVAFVEPRKSESCPMCSCARGSVLAYGDGRQLPTRKHAG